MIIGRLMCAKCGKDCTSLYGFALMTRGSIRNQQTVKELAAVKDEFGESEFVWCWSCTAKAFGVKTLAEIEAEKPKPKEPCSEPKLELEPTESKDKVQEPVENF